MRFVIKDKRLSFRNNYNIVFFSKHSFLGTVSSVRDFHLCSLCSEHNVHTRSLRMCESNVEQQTTMVTDFILYLCFQ